MSGSRRNLDEMQTIRSRGYRTSHQFAGPALPRSLRGKAGSSHRPQGMSTFDRPCPSFTPGNRREEREGCTMSTKSRTPTPERL